MEKYKILSENFIFIDSEGRKTFKATALDEICEVGFILQVSFNNKVYVSSCPINIQDYIDNEGATKRRAKDFCLKQLEKKLCQ